MLVRESVVDLGPGAVLAGRYQIRRVLGKGATGVVLEADDRVSRSLVALKVFKPDIATDERWQEIVGSELRHARLLQHPNVCRVFDAGEADGYRFLSLEYAGGGSLRQRLREGAAERRDDDRVADARAIISGLAAIHAAGIIHRDVKPDNVLRMEDGRLVVTDFGLAVAPGQTTFVSGYSGAVGTPSYMAPEVALGGDATMASDVFSLGVILHEIFFDRRPDWDTTKRGRFLRSPVHPGSTRLERAMAALCASCLEELAPRRPATAEEVKRRFERAVLGHTGTALQALRTSRWGLAIGLASASALTAGIFYVVSAGQGPIQAEVTGTAADWRSRARVLARRDGRVRCVQPSPDGRSVRIILAAPAGAEVIDVASGKSAPWDVAPALYERGCPHWSDDGRSVAFLGGPRFADIMVSESPDGRGARRLTEGHAPRWLPGGRELAFAHGRQRVGVTDLSGFSQILGEGAASGESLVDLGVDPRGGQLAVLYRHMLSDRSAVVLYRMPGWQLAARIEVPAKLTRVMFDGTRDRLLVVLDEAAGHTLATLSRDGELRRKGGLAGGRLSDLLFMKDGTVAITQARSVTALLASPGGGERELLVAPGLGRASATAGGEHTLLERQLEDGRWIISDYDRDQDRVVRLTDGQSDRDPLLMPGGREFIYLEGAQRRRVRLCALDAPSDCRSLMESEEPIAFLLGVSPSGKQIAHASLQGAQYRLRIRPPAGAVRDLGPLSTPCRLRWPAEDRLWTFERSADFTGWVELDVEAGRATGRRDLPGPLDADQCPVLGEGEPLVKLRARATTSLHRLASIE